MKQKTFTAVCMLLLCITVSMAQRTFTHPGSILNAGDLKRIKQHVENQEEPWYESWLKMKTSAYGNCTRTANPSTEIGGSDGNRQRASGDAYAALVEAIEWHITGQKRYADHAVKLLSAWGNKVTTANAELFQFPARTMSIAAEMLRYEDGTFYEGWNETDLANFKKMVRDVLVPACRSQAKNNPMTSWSAPAVTGILAAGILLDDESLYNEGLDYFRSKTVSGSVYNTIADNGQVKEMGRDNVHAMLALNDLAQQAQIAWSQGDDLWGEGDNRLLKGFEYFCTYNMGHEDLDYSPVTASDGTSHWYYISTHNNGFRLLPDGHCYECVYHHYKEQKQVDTDTEAPNLKAFARLTRPQLESESLGFGTLLFTIDAASSPLVTDKPAAANQLEARAGEGRVWLRWNDNQENDASGFRILRSTDGHTFSTISDHENYTRKSYTDESAEPGNTYYYKVVLYNRAGDAEESDAVSVRVPITAGLPEGWKTADIGNGWATGYYTNSMENSFVIEGGGNGFRRNDEGHGYVYHKLQGNGSLTVRIVSTEQTFNAVGIMLRSALSSGSAQMGITLGGTGLRYCHAVSRPSSGAQTSWTNGCDFTYAPVWMRLERNGNTVKAFQSRDGETWHLIHQTTVSLPSTVFVGMLVASSETYRASFDHVSLTTESIQEETSTVPACLQASCQTGGTARLVWNGVYGADKYNVYRNGSLIGETMTNSFDDTDLAEGTYSYSVSAVVDGLESTQTAPETIDIVRIEKLTGIVIGTSGSWNNNSDATRSAVFDGQLDTFFDAAQANGAWAGIDLGEGKEAQVTEIRYCPRKSHPQRMDGGRFQAAQTASFSDAVTLHTVSGTPATETMTAVTIDVPDHYRYLRYISPNNGYCNVAEVEFYGRFKEPDTAVNAITTSRQQENDILYDLQGRRILTSQPNKGIYIRNGHKQIIK